MPARGLMAVIGHELSDGKRTAHIGATDVRGDGGCVYDKLDNDHRAKTSASVRVALVKNGSLWTFKVREEKEALLVAS